MTTDARRAEIIEYYRKWHGHAPTEDKLCFAEALAAEAEARGIAKGLEMAAVAADLMSRGRSCTDRPSWLEVSVWLSERALSQSTTKGQGR